MGILAADGTVNESKTIEAYSMTPAEAATVRIRK